MGSNTSSRHLLAVINSTYFLIHLAHDWENLLIYLEPNKCLQNFASLLYHEKGQLSLSVLFPLFLI